MLSTGFGPVRCDPESAVRRAGENAEAYVAAADPVAAFRGPPRRSTEPVRCVPRWGYEPLAVTSNRGAACARRSPPPRRPRMAATYPGPSLDSSMDAAPLREDFREELLGAFLFGIGEHGTRVSGFDDDSR